MFSNLLPPPPPPTAHTLTFVRQPLPRLRSLFSFVVGQAFLSMLCAMRWGVFIL